MNESIVNIAEAMILILIILGVFVLVFYHPIRRFLRRKSELKENQRLLTQNEAHPLRNLTPEEITYLNDKIKSASSFSPIYILGFIIVLIYTFTNLNSKSTEAANNSQFIPFLLLLIPILITFAIFYQNREKAKKMKQDLTSQVYMVKGKVYKESHGSRYSSDLLVTIRGVTFDGKQKLASGAKLFDEISQDQEVIIEYTPNSKHVWKIQPVTTSI